MARLDGGALSAFRYAQMICGETNQGSGVMKKIIPPIVAATLLLAPGFALATEAIYGVWVREGHPEDKLEFFDCAGKLCAKGLQPMPDGTPAPLVLRNAAKAGANNWKGDLFNPEDGKTYKGEITLEKQDQLSLSGCLVAFLCQSETWTKVSGPTQKPKAPEPKAAEGKSGESKTGDKPGDAKPAKDAGHEPAKGASHEPAKGPSHEPAKGAGHEPAKGASHEPAKGSAHEPAKAAPGHEPAKAAPAKPAAEDAGKAAAKPKTPPKPKAAPQQ